ncbi:hypothetical protein BSK66_25920 [Paenibacillus odorifer]|uniref:Uncharacterized protein n=1 Tax=Paenibacillus odorifer TaxID=189426 RepID=A0A1R0X1P7_9BACL|nr:MULTISPECIES: hypothetical protein [Paenibacillus]ETT61877.1 hypothetical protein C171_11546 [Paenibacillus sp. FSL H8-237]OMD26539.1 hypothetical protein BJP51_26775 [Paenibacillus odorifer]OME49958.1 hypothetical protein BSK66_25920 [Paenibacillus odorifer]
MNKVTEQEFQLMKSFLEQYLRNKAVIEGYEKNEQSKSLELMDTYLNVSRCIGLVDRAIETIQDEEIKKIIVRRFMKGYRRRDVVLYFSGLGFTDRTVDRKIKHGVIQIVEAVKTWGQLHRFMSEVHEGEPVL